MSKLRLKELNEMINSTTDKVEYQKLQIIRLVKFKKIKPKEAAKSIGKKPGDIHQWIYKYKHGGVEALLGKKRGGRREELAHMTFEEEKKLLDSVTTDATQGLIVIAKSVKKLAEEKLGKSVSTSYAYELLHRHGWRKIEPRPKNPKSSKDKQEEFKKQVPDLIKEQIDTFPKEDVRPIKFFFSR